MSKVSTPQGILYHLHYMPSLAQKHRTLCSPCPARTWRTVPFGAWVPIILLYPRWPQYATHGRPLSLSLSFSLLALRPAAVS